ncbi:MAG: plasmid pRiA4b ORF-3 family protein, partial [Treponema sp.]|nr:plasmid pRiA4b ORF-3 family protein [Treponema sp.]
KRACPPENCGGIWGYEEVLEALKAPKKKKNRELLDWLEDFDPEYFEVDEVNSLFRSDDLNDDDDDDDDDYDDAY